MYLFLSAQLAIFLVGQKIWKHGRHVGSMSAMICIYEEKNHYLKLPCKVLEMAQLIQHLDKTSSKRVMLVGCSYEDKRQVQIA